ncbi:MAG: hypothetical protein LBH75_00290 [Treponema sp.]|jgi:hypothetical protein|nr:hypothetical protein [Treponema sp.]
MKKLALTAFVLLLGTGLFAQAKLNASTFDDRDSQGGTSELKLTEAQETIAGKTVTTYTFEGRVTNKYQYGFAGAIFIPADDATVAALKTAKAVTFWAQDLGSAFPRFGLSVCTPADITDSAYYQKELPFPKQPRQITVKIPQDLRQPQYWGEKKSFNQSNATQLQFQSTNNGSPGNVRFKIWDIQFVK